MKIGQCQLVLNANTMFYDRYIQHDHFFGITAPSGSASASLFSAACDDPPSSALAHGLRIRGFLPRPPPLLPVGVHQGPHRALELHGHHEVVPLLSTLIATATPMWATSSNAFRCGSAYSGYGTIGTPCHRLSSTEFQPPCVTKPPTAGCARMSFCGAHVGHTRRLRVQLGRRRRGHLTRPSHRAAWPSCVQIDRRRRARPSPRAAHPSRVKLDRH